MKTNLLQPAARPLFGAWISLVALLACTATLAAAPRGSGEIERRLYHFEEAGKDIEYRLFVPKKYDHDEKTPLVVLLHGLGSNPSQVIRYGGITTEAEARGYIVVAPFGYNERGWYGSRGKGKEGPFFGNESDPANLGELSEKDVMNVLGIVRGEFNIDPDRMFLMGHSMGGGGTIHLGATQPELWAGLAPLAPAFQGSPSILEKMKSLPMMIVTGEKDSLVPVVKVRQWVARMKELEIEHVYKEIPGGNHFNTITANPKMIGEVFTFFDKYKRPPSEEDAADAYRVFTNSGGKKIKAKPIASTRGKLTIEREDGKVFTLPVTSLSDADQKYVEDWSQKNSKEPAAP